VPSVLTDEQNIVVRQWLRELKARYRTQKALGKVLGVSQVTVSQLIMAKGERGTTTTVFVRAGRLLGIPSEEIARRLGVDVGEPAAAPFADEFLEACPPNLRRLCVTARATLPPNVARQLLRIFEVDHVDREVPVWKAIAHMLEASADTPSEDAEEEPAAPPSSRDQWSGDEKHRSSRKVRVAGKR
jgi:hypothetical protein